MIVLRATCSHHSGTGHLNRVINLAAELLSRDAICQVITDDNSLARSIASLFSGNITFVKESQILPDSIASCKVLVLDCPPSTTTVLSTTSSRKKLSVLNDSGVSIVSLGHLSQNSQYYRTVIDLYPHREIHAANYHEGPDYLILKKEFSDKPVPIGNERRALVSMGGTDPYNLTHTTLELLGRLQFPDTIDVVLGSGYQKDRENELQRLIEEYQLRTHLHWETSDMLNLMRRSTFGILAFGTTAYEMMTQQRPMLVFSHYQWQEESAKLFESLNCCQYLGCAEQSLHLDKLATKISSFLGAPGKQEEMARRGREVVDGKGILRVANMVEKLAKTDKNNQLDVLFILAHPGDELFGCGGTLLKHLKAGQKVGLITLGEGVSSRVNESDSPTTILSARKEIRTALQSVMEKLEIADYYYYRFEDNRFDSHDLLDIIKVIEVVLKRHRPSIIYTHHPSDLNVDHRITFEATLTAARPTADQSVQQILSIEVPTSSDWGNVLNKQSFKANWFVDIEDVKQEKIELVKQYQAELREDPHPRSLEAISQRSIQWGRVTGRKDVEAFELQRYINS